MIIFKEPFENINIKYAAFDLDGTLLDKNGRLFDNVEKGLECLLSCNIEPIIVTGRPLDSYLSLSIDDSVLKLFNNIIICSNGNAFFNKETKQLVVNHTLPKEVIIQAKDLFESIGDFVVEMGGVHYAQNRMASLKYCMLYGTKRELIKKFDFDTLIGNEITEILVFQYDKNQNYAVSDELDCKISQFDLLSTISIIPKNICKAQGLSTFLNMLKDKRSLNSVIAFGDGLNDCELLRKSKIGLAVQFSHQEAIVNSDIFLNEPIGDYLLRTFQKEKVKEMNKLDYFLMTSKFIPN